MTLSEGSVVDDVEALRSADPEVGQLIILLSLGYDDTWRETVTPATAARLAAWLAAHPAVRDALAQRRRTP